MQDQATTDARHELAQIIARLRTISHVNAIDYEGRSQTSETSESIGGKRPPGGIDRRDDREPDFRLKSADHFATRAAGCRSISDYRSVLIDAQLALKAWTHPPEQTNPEWGSLAWRRQIVRDVESGRRTFDKALQFYSISRATLYRYLAAYGTEEAA